MEYHKLMVKGKDLWVPSRQIDKYMLALEDEQY